MTSGVISRHLSFLVGGGVLRHVRLEAGRCSRRRPRRSSTAASLVLARQLVVRRGYFQLVRLTVAIVVAAWLVPAGRVHERTGLCVRAGAVSGSADEATVSRPRHNRPARALPVRRGPVFRGQGHRTRPPRLNRRPLPGPRGGNRQPAWPWPNGRDPSDSTGDRSGALHRDRERTGRPLRPRPESSIDSKVSAPLSAVPPKATCKSVRPPRSAGSTSRLNQLRATMASRSGGQGDDVSGLTLANVDWCNFHLPTGTNLFDYPSWGTTRTSSSSAPTSSPTTPTSRPRPSWRSQSRPQRRQLYGADRE